MYRISSTVPRFTILIKLTLFTVLLSASPIDIEGWTIKDNDSDSHLIANGGPLVIPAGGFVVLARNGNPGTNGGVTADYIYVGITLGIVRGRLAWAAVVGNYPTSAQSGATPPRGHWRAPTAKA